MRRCRPPSPSRCVESGHARIDTPRSAHASAQDRTTRGRRYRPRSHDLETDELLDVAPVEAVPDSVVVVDGSFLQSAPWQDAWDEVVWLDAGEPAALRRAVQRNGAQFGGAAATALVYAERYHAAGRRYIEEVSPMQRAGIVVGHDDVAAPVLRRIGGPAGSTAQLFSYGTLQLPAVQLSVFGRRLSGTRESLPGHRIERVERVGIAGPAPLDITDMELHLIVRPSGRPTDHVDGTVLTITTDELPTADTYEAAECRRVRVPLESGVAAWVCLAADAVR